VRAQQSERIRRIGWLDGTNGSDPETITRIAVFRSELQALGWVEGQTIEIIFRFAADRIFKSFDDIVDL
jgi:hypothetical protein